MVSHGIGHFKASGYGVKSVIACVDSLYSIVFFSSVFATRFLLLEHNVIYLGFVEYAAYICYAYTAMIFVVVFEKTE